MPEYDLLMELNRKEVFGEEISDAEKSSAISAFLGCRLSADEVRAFRQRMHINPTSDRLYPYFFLPPFDSGKKRRLIQGYLPKTTLLYANHYELEILRLLSCYAPDHPSAKEMLNATLNRLQDAGFGTSRTQNEEMAVGICVLRLLATARPDYTDWLNRLLVPLGELFLSFGPGQAAVQQGIPVFYLLMAFKDINNEYTGWLLNTQKNWLLNLLRRGWITGTLSNGKLSEADTFNVMYKHIIRNALATLPEFDGIERHEIYVNPQDNRCYCHI